MLAPEILEKRDACTNTLLWELLTRGFLPVGAQTLSWDLSYGRYTWNASKAWEVIQGKPHPLRQIPAAHLAHVVTIATTDPARVAVSDPSQPGILALCFNLEFLRWESVVIDGNHRAVRAHQMGQPFFCYALTPVESWALMLEHATHGESVFYAEHLLCEPGCMIDAERDQHQA
jgi:hypothetical protein